MPEATSPIAPSVAQAVCKFGSVTNQRITLAANSGAIAYTQSRTVTPGGTVTVTATLGSGFTWENTSVSGWTFTDTNATFTVLLDDPECTTVSPVLPTLTQAVCEGGVVSRLQVAIPADEEGISYIKSGEEVSGGTVTVVARLADGFAWADTSLEGWTFTPTIATLVVELDPVECAGVLPILPVVAQGCCDLGVLNLPETSIVSTSNGVTYSSSGDAVPGGTVVYTATLQPGFQWSGEAFDDWVFGTSTATYAVTFEPIDCIEVAPIQPPVTQAACAFGSVTSPVVILSEDTSAVTYVVSGSQVPGGTVTVTATVQGVNGFVWQTVNIPADWTFTGDTATYTFTLDAAECDSVFYTFDGPIEAGATVVITATLEDGFAWDDMTVPGWIFTESSATYTVVLESSGCAPADPGLPAITEGSCFEGVLTTPSLELPANSNAVTYSRVGNDVPGGTVVITATLNPGFSWSGTQVDGWSYTTPSATFTVQYTEVLCVEVLPVAPIITLGDCIDGELIGSPDVQLASNTEALSYALSGDVQFGSSIEVTASLADGFRWAAAELEGWVFTSLTTATFTIVLVEPNCDVTPAPGATNTPDGSDGADVLDETNDGETQPVTSLPSTGAGAGETSFLIGLLGAALLLLAMARIATIRGGRSMVSTRR